MTQDQANAAPTSLPWPAVVVVLCVCAGAAAVGAALVDGGSRPALIGAVSGLGAAALAPRGKLWPMAGLTVAAFALLLANPGPVALWAISLAFCAGAGVEATQTGGRAAVMLLYAWLSIALIATLPPREAAIACTIGGLLLGWLVAYVFKIEGTAVRPKGDMVFGCAMAAFLAIGLAIALFAIRHIHQPFSHWIALIFVLRAMAPPGMTRRALLRFGVGATLGSLAALLLIALGLPHYPALALGAVAMVLGIRTLPHPAPFAPAAFSAGVLLIAAQDIGPAVFRLEVSVAVVVFCVAMTSLLSLALNMFRSQPENASPPANGA